MAISRKRPSAGSPKEGHHEDSRPSKKTATRKYNVQSSEVLPFPKSGPVPVVSMILYFGEQEETARALLDTGSTVPILSLGFVEKHQVPIAERATKRMAEADPEPEKEEENTAAVPREIKKARTAATQRKVWEVESSASEGESDTKMPDFP